MGTKLNSQNDANKAYVQALDSMLRITFQRYDRIWIHNDTMFKYSPWGREYYKHLKIVHDFTESVMKERIKARESAKKQGIEEEDAFGVKKKKVFLDMLLDFNESAQENNKMTYQEITDEVHTFMFEGHDTTSSAVLFTLFLLATHPDVQEKVYEEQKSIFGDDMSRPVTFKDLPMMRYLEMVMKETLRLYPSVPFVSRRLKEDFQLGDKLLPKNTSLQIHIRSIQRDPKWYKDPDVFNPDNFLPENIAARSPYAFVPFSAGPRNCIGQKFAILEEKVEISTLVRAYKFETSDTPESLKLYAEMILKTLNGLNLKLTSRNKVE